MAQGASNGQIWTMHDLASWQGLVMFIVTCIPSAAGSRWLLRRLFFLLEAEQWRASWRLMFALMVFTVTFFATFLVLVGGLLIIPFGWHDEQLLPAVTFVLVLGIVLVAVPGVASALILAAVTYLRSRRLAAESNRAGASGAGEDAS